MTITTKSSGVFHNDDDWGRHVIVDRMKSCVKDIGSGRLDSMVRGLILVAVALFPLSVARAADLGGVAMPDTRVVDGTRMLLNGIGLRTFSILAVPIYVAGLYLEKYNNDADTILRSRERKLLDIRFVRDVDAEDARKAWRVGFEQNCKTPCSLNSRDVQRFLAAVPSVHKGDEATLLFTSRGVEVKFNGQPRGDVADAHFADTMLATFIGPEPPTTRLKRELLGNRD